MLRSCSKMTILADVGRNFLKNLQPHQLAQNSKDSQSLEFLAWHGQIDNGNCIYWQLIIGVFENSWAFVRNIETMVCVHICIVGLVNEKFNGNDHSSKTAFTYAIKIDDPQGN